MSVGSGAVRGMQRPTLAPQQVSQVPYLPGLDVMRALAVVAVMIYHANSDWLKGGFLGVEVFFVISGYLITLLLIAEKERSGEISLSQFWLRRARRLLPALGVLMLLLSLWTALFESDALGKLRGDVLAGLFYVSNWYQIFIGAGYAAANDFAPLRHLWSLAVEEQFYIVWPLVMLLLLRRGPRRISDTARWLFLASIVVTVVVALLYHPGPVGTVTETPEAYWQIFGRDISKADALYLSTVTRASGLLLGCAFAMVWRPHAIMRGPLRHKSGLLDLLSIIGLVWLGVMCVTVGFLDADGADPILFRGGFFMTSVATLMMIAAVTHPQSVSSRALATPVLLWIGTRSYGLYLFHWPIYQIIRDIAGNKLKLHEFVLAMIVTAIITELSYRFVETPIRRGAIGRILGRERRQRSGDRRAIAVVTAVVSALTLFAGARLATAELIQNEVQQSLDAGSAVVCDVVNDPTCANTGAGTTNPADGAGQQAATTVAPDPGNQTTIAPDPGTETTVAEPATTAAPTTVADANAPIARLALGDSVMLGAAPQLTERNFTVDAQESRAFISGLDTILTLEQNGRLGDQVAIHLGTNGPIGQSDMDRMMDGLAGVPTVLLLTNDVDRDYTAGNNAIIYDAVNANPNVYVLDWQGLAPSCPGNCFYEDDLHLRPDGADYYAQLIQDRFAQVG